MEFAAQNKLIFFDCETSGKDSEDRILQLCWKHPGDGTGLAPLSGVPVTDLFNPGRSIKFEAMAVHHITEAMVKDKPEFKNSVMFKTLIEFAKDHVFVAHNAPFDIDMLSREGIKVGRFIDTLKVAQYLFDEPSYKLQYLRYRFGLKVDGKAHDAEGDVAVLEALFNFLYKGIVQDSTGEEDAINKMIGISSQPILLRRMPFGKHSGVPFDEVPKEYISWLNGQKDLSPDLKYTLEFYLKPKVEVEKQARLL